MSEPMQAVNDALAAQTAAIADLAGELATEHEQWLAAAAAGDQAQATEIVAAVQANTDRLLAMTTDLAASDPSAPPAP
jgi:DNA-binding FadR family transcriptional regulator